MKTCTQCGETKDITEFHRDARAPDGLCRFCKTCAKQKSRESYARNIEKRRTYARERASQHKETRALYQKKYHQLNRERLNAYCRNWRKRHKTNRSLQSREANKTRMRERYATDPAYRSRIKAQATAYRRKHLVYCKTKVGEWRKNNPEKTREYTYRWLDRIGRKEYMRKMRLRHRAARQAAAANYNARRYGGTGEITDAYIHHLHVWQDNCCFYCNCYMNKKEVKTHVEHVVPLIRGGTNTPQNTVLACENCNCSKRDRLFEVEWKPPIVLPVFYFHSIAETGKLQRILTDLPVKIRANSLRLNALSIKVLSTFWAGDRTAPVSPIRAFEESGELVLFDYEIRERPEAILNILRMKAGLAESIGARKLVIAAPTAEEARDFLNRFHFQGFIKATHYLGLQGAGGEWRGMMAITETPRGYTLSRMCFRDHVPGGLSRLLEAFRKTAPTGDIFSYCDLRLGSGNGYMTVGFVHLGDTSPWTGFANGTGLFHREHFSKVNLAAKLDWFSPDHTEKLQTRVNGLIQVTGARQRRFILPGR